MGKNFTHTTKEQRMQIKEMLDSGVKKTIIASTLGICERTVYYEIKRGTINGQYDPEYAEQQYIKSNCKRKREPILSTNTELANYISMLILQEHKSPNQIMEILQKNPKYKSVFTSLNTIYNAIDCGLIPGVSRESLNTYQTTVFSNALIHIPKWVREKLNIYDDDILNIEVDGNKLIFTKAD